MHVYAEVCSTKFKGSYSQSKYALDSSLLENLYIQPGLIL